MEAALKHGFIDVFSIAFAISGKTFYLCDRMN